MYELTLKMLEQAPNCSIMHEGLTKIEHPWFNHAKCIDSENKVLVRFVLAKGGGRYDWAIYHSLSSNITKEDFLDDPYTSSVSPMIVYQLGQKLYNKYDIASIVKCSPEILKYYRV